MQRTILACGAALVAGYLVLPAWPLGQRALSGEGPVRVLFLGDDGHHVPRERVAAALVPLHRRGVQVEYTEELAALNGPNLARFDVLLVYANHTSLGAGQEKALLDYVRGGGGLAAVHSASYCFLNSADYVALVGAQFASHGDGTFAARTVASEHPVMAGHAGFTSWDETYVHTRHADDRTILAVRERAAGEPGGAGDEPWTWVRQEGRGRVFYTASGHDLRTWNNEGFIDLLTRGVKWAAGRAEPGAVWPLAPFEEVPTTTGVPDYVPGQRTGTKRSMQAPLSPEASAARLVVPAGLEARLFASEPLLQGKPIHLAFDERGRAWVLETVDYPNERRDTEGRDRVVILTDTDGDGRADRRQVFAEGLSIPTALAFARGGVVVFQAPHTLFLRDTDGDDVADERAVLFSGWGTGDTHAGPSNLRYGLDNRLWGTVGYSGFGGTVGGTRHGFAQAIFAFEPDGSALEQIASTTNNTWGLGFSEEGSIFGSTANGNPSVHAALAARHYERVPGLAPGALQTIAERMDLHPITDRVRQVDFHGKYTAAAGHALYTARLLPAWYWNRVAFVNSPTGHTVGQFVLEHAGSDHVARDGWNFLASDDEWTAPVLSEVGPDGAVWVIDWYNYIVQHNPTPPGFETGPGNAYETELRDKTRGRIYRIVPAGAEVPVSAQSLAGATADELVVALDDDNMLWRLHAQRLLVERGERDVVPALLARLAAAQVDEVGNDPGALHALGTLAGLGLCGGRAASDLDEETALALEDTLVRALRHPAWAVRRAALTLLPRVEWARDMVLTSGLLTDASAKVQLSALLALAEMPPSAEAGAAAFTALVAADAARDRWLVDAATIAAAAHDAGFLTALLASPLAEAARAADSGGPRPNLVTNGSFEEGPEGQARGWRVRTYGGEATHEVVRGVARTGERSLRITSERGADTSLFTELALEPNASYRLTAWIKTDGLDRGSGRGAQLNVHELQSPQPVRTEGLEGSEDWRKVEALFESDGRRNVTLNCLFGGWGWSRGTAYFDDVVVEKVAGDLLAGGVGRALSRVMRAYAARGPVESVVSTLSALRGAPEALATALLEGLTSGWPAGTAPTLETADKALLAGLASELPDAPRANLAALLAQWGVTGDAVIDVQALAVSLAARVLDDASSSAARVGAAERLVALGQEATLLRAAAAVLAPNTEPELAVGLVRALGQSARPEVAEALLSQWSTLGPRAQRAAVSVLLRREASTVALLERIAGGALPPSLLDAAAWTQVTERATTEAAEALIARARGAALNPDRAAVIARFQGVLTMAADASRGQALYGEHCAKCHMLGGVGVRIGPELDGIGARAPEELLIAILDPNRDVEGTYQLWTARTTDGVMIAGRLVSETRTSIELVDASGEGHLLAREDLAQIVASPLSLMPAGLEVDLGEQGLADLLLFLSKQH